MYLSFCCKNALLMRVVCFLFVCFVFDCVFDGGGWGEIQYIVNI